MTDSTHHIEIEDLSAEARQIAEAIGIEGLLALAGVMGGGWVYIPHPKRLAVAARNRRIRAEFNGRNLRDLAIKNGLTVRRIRSIVAEGTSAPRAEEKAGVAKQLKMF